MRKWIFAAAVALLFSSNAWAASISFTYTGTGSGSLGGTAFSDAAFTITATADTNDRQGFANGYFIDHLTASIDIAGLGAASFVTGTRTFVNNSAQIVGFSRATATGADLYDSADAAYGSWDMLSSIGPIAGAFYDLGQFNYTPVLTSRGVLTFGNDASAGTFQASVPEPAMLVLLSLGALGLGLRRCAMK